MRMESSDLVLAVFDLSHPIEEEDLSLLRLMEGRAVIAVLNKNDAATPEDCRAWEVEVGKVISNVVVMSARSGGGLEKLEEMIPRVLGLNRIDDSAAMLANERQRDCVKRSLDALEEAVQAVRLGITYDAVSVCLEDAVSPLMELTGERVSDVVIEQVFERFCVGK